MGQFVERIIIDNIKLVIRMSGQKRKGTKEVVVEQGNDN